MVTFFYQYKIAAIVNKFENLTYCYFALLFKT